MSQALEALKETYFTVDRNFDRLMTACTTDEQRNALRRDYEMARDNFLSAQNKILDDGEEMVKHLLGEMRQAQERIQAELVNLQNVVTALEAVTVAVNIGSKLTCFTD
jgi:hypothetical protein